jgi:DNA-binding NtrC family response regulator
VDDDDSIRGTLKKALEFKGYEVLTAEDGMEALSTLQNETVDLIVTDLFMPGMDGIQFAIQLKKLAADTPFIAMSGGGVYENMSMLDVAAKMGAVRTLEKPFDVMVFLETVAEVLES